MAANTEIGNTSETSKLPAYYVPEQYFTYKGAGKGPNTFTYSCTKCFTIVSCSESTRANLKTHLKRLHPFALKTYEEECKKHDKRRKKEPTPVENNEDLIEVPH